MKRLIGIFIISLIFSCGNIVVCQFINANPDLNGDPWWTGGYTISSEEQAFINTLPQLNVSPLSKNLPPPSMVDNSTRIYFRSIFMQDGGSCAQASAIIPNSR
jgi:hypothetical protein